MLGTLLAVATLPSLSAQGVEITPYFGGVWPDSSSVGELKTSALWGIRAGFHFDSSFALEGNFGYINHFEVKGTDPKSRGYLWELSPTYVFDSENWPVPSSFSPHIAFGLGGITTQVKDPDRFSYNVFNTTQTLGGVSQTSVRQVNVSSGDTFFTVSAGGGFKVNRGPVGFRGDLRARILPNYYRSSPVWMEATVGVTFVLGRGSSINP